MTTSASPPNFSMIRWEVPWVNPNGTPTTYFFRLIENMFAAAGNGQSPTVTDLVLNTYSQIVSSGPDYEKKLSDLTTLLMGIVNPSGRIAALEAQVADLQRQIVEALRKPADLNGLKAQVDALTALTMGIH